MPHLKHVSSRLKSPPNLFGFVAPRNLIARTIELVSPMNVNTRMRSCPAVSSNERQKNKRETLGREDLYVFE